MLNDLSFSLKICNEDYPFVLKTMFFLYGTSWVVLMAIKKTHSFLTTVDVNVIYITHIVKNCAIYRLM